MNHKVCFECSMEHPTQRMDCSSKKTKEAYHLVLEKLQYMTYDQLSKLEWETHVVLLDRKLDVLFDEQ